MNTKYGHNKIRNTGAGLSLRYPYATPTLFLRYTAILLLMLVAGVNSVWAQDYSGTYYIANANTNSDRGYKGYDNEANFYLCPAHEYLDNGAVTTTDNGVPFLTTYQTKQTDEALWIVEKVTGQNYYTFKQKDGENFKYLTVNDALTGYKGHRKRVHLEVLTPSTLSNRNYFVIEQQKTTDGIKGFSISCLDAHKSGNNKYLNPPSGNFPSYISGKNGNEEPKSGGIVGFYLVENNGALELGSVWYFEVPKPVIHIDENNKLTFSCANENVTIHYIIDGENPSTDGTDDVYHDTDDITIPEGEHTIKAIAVMNSGYTNYASGIITQEVKKVCAPVITINADNSVTITSATEGATIYYKLGGDNPTIENATQSASISSILPSQGPIKAFAVKEGWANSSIAVESNIPAKTIEVNSTNGTLTSTDPIVYNGTAHQPAFTIKDGETTINAEEYTATYSNNINPGTATITITDNAGGDYNVSGSFTFTIEKTPLTITAGSDTKVYDGTALTKNSYTSEGLMAGDVIESVTITGSQTNAGSSNNVPSEAVIKKGDEDVNANYNITYTNGTLEVTKKPLTVTADAKTKAYGEDDPALTYTSEGLINDDVITGALSRDAGENAGVYAILQGTLTAGNNYAITYTGANLTIRKVGLTITANNNTITYGNAPAGNGATYEGFVNSDTESALGGTLAYDYSYTQYGDVGNTYTITPKGLTSGNYDIIFVDGTLTVTAKEVVINWTNTSFAYNGEEHCPTATVKATDLVNSDEVGITVTGAQTNAGEHTATASALTGDKSGNYVLPEANTQSFTIGRKSIGDGTTPAEGISFDFGENNSILLTDDAIGCTLVAPTDYIVGDDTSTSDKYSQRTVTGTGNYTGSFEVRNAVVSLTTDASEEGWSATFAAEAANPSDIGHALPEGIMAFIITGIRGEWAIPEPLTYIPAGVPVLLVATKKLNGFVVTTAEIEEEEKVTSAQIENNMLEEVTETTPGYNSGTQSVPFATKQIYLLYNNEFVFNKAGNLKKGKVYLNPNHAAPSLSPSLSPARLQIAWKQTTGIQNLQDDRTISIENGVWYTIDGRRLNGKPSAKGLYIVDGKKTVVK